MNLKLYGFLIINFSILVFIINHQTVFDGVDTLIMPDSSQLCKVIPIGLIDKLKIEMNSFPMQEIEKELSYLSLKNGGFPSKNKSGLYKSAIIIPYKDRLKNLELFLRNIHPFLDKQDIYYGLYVVEPDEKLRFNKGILMNAGFLEVLKEENWDCVIFHDVDLLPENNQNIYRCDDKTPKQFAIAVSSYGYQTGGYFKKLFGGCTGYTAEQFKKINGFSNLYYGWGLEDDDARLRVLSKFPSINRISADVGRYYANCHTQQRRNPERFLIYINAKNRLELDGLNTLNYKVVKTENKPLYRQFFISYE